MIHVPEMRQLVQDDVVTHKTWNLEQAPINRNRSAPRAGAPSRPLIANCHALDTNFVQCRQFKRTVRQFPGSKAEEESLNFRPQVRTQFFDPDRFGCQTDHACVTGWVRLQFHTLASKQDLRPDMPRWWTLWTSSESQQLLLEPADILFCKPFGLYLCTAPRNSYSRAAVTPQPQDVPTCPSIPNEPEFNMLSPNP